MGTYLIIPKRKGLNKELKTWFNKWKPFYNDFMREHTFKDIFGYKDYKGNIIFKIGVLSKRFYLRESLKEIRIIKNLKQYGGGYNR